MGIEAFQGLSVNLNKEAQARSDRNTLLQLLNLKERDEQQEAMAQAQYGEHMAAISKQANSLLENDRLVINQKAAEYRKEIRESLKSHGGSYAGFLKNGGIAMLRDYQRKVVESEEFINYQNNKINMEKIIHAKDIGKGHLIAEQDLNRLKEYQTNGSGTITYNGLLNEVEIDPKAFEWGYKLTPEDVLATGNNKQLIIANFEADMGRPPITSFDDKELKEYIKFKGYGGIGTNDTMRINRLRAEATAAKKKAEDKKYSAAVGVGMALNQVGKKGLSEMTFDNGFGRIEHIAKLGVKKNASTMYAPSRFHNSWKDIGLPGSRELTGSPRYRLKGAADSDISGMQLAEGYYGEQFQADKDGGYVIDPREITGAYRGSGTLIDDEASWFENWEARRYVPGRTLMAYKTIDPKTGKPMLVVENVDKKGNVIESEDGSYGSESNLKGNGTLVVEMRNAKDPGNSFYQEIDANSVYAQKVLSEMLGDTDDITEPMLENARANQYVQSAMPVSNKEVQAIKEGAVTASKEVVSRTSDLPVWDSTLYEMVRNQYKTDKINRDALVKSYYTTFSQGEAERLQQGLETKHFNGTLEQFKLQEQIMNPEVSDKDIMEQIFKEDSKGTTEDAKIAYLYYEMWNSIYDQIITTQ